MTKIKFPTQKQKTLCECYLDLRSCFGVLLLDFRELLSCLSPVLVLSADMSFFSEPLQRIAHISYTLFLMNMTSDIVMLEIFKILTRVRDCDHFIGWSGINCKKN